jgi:hypothetical protein
VKVNCLYGTGKITPRSYYFDKIPGKMIKVLRYEFGDGSVTDKEARICDNFKNFQDQRKYPVKFYSFKDTGHRMVDDELVLQKVFEITTKEVI